MVSTYLLEREAFGLGDKQIHVTETKDESAEENQQNQRTNVFGNTGREEREKEVPDPILINRSVSVEDARVKVDVLVALPRAIALGRTRSGKLSPRYTQGVGPQKIELQEKRQRQSTWRVYIGAIQ
jgi:hypothetical protein